MPELDLVRVFIHSDNDGCYIWAPVPSPIHVSTTVYVTDLTDEDALLSHHPIGGSPRVIFNARFNPENERYLLCQVGHGDVGNTDINFDVIFTPTPGLLGSRSKWSLGNAPMTSEELDHASFFNEVQESVFRILTGSHSTTSYVGYEEWPIEWMPLDLRQLPWVDLEDIKGRCRDLIGHYAEDWAEGYEPQEEDYDTYEVAEGIVDRTRFVTRAEYKGEWSSRHPALVSMVLRPYCSKYMERASN
jgi:hypothetical protein